MGVARDCALAKYPNLARWRRRHYCNSSFGEPARPRSASSASSSVWAAIKDAKVSLGRLKQHRIDSFRDALVDKRRRTADTQRRPPILLHARRAAKPSGVDVVHAKSHPRERIVRLLLSQGTELAGGLLARVQRAQGDAALARANARGLVLLLLAHVEAGFQAEAARHMARNKRARVCVAQKVQ